MSSLPHDDKLAVRSSGTAYTNVDGLMLRESDVRAAAKMTDSQLVHRVKQGFQKIHDELPWIIELRKRFANRPRGKANIAGCKSWMQFCDKVLRRSPRQIQRVLQEADSDVSSRSSDAAPAQDQVHPVIASGFRQGPEAGTVYKRAPRRLTKSVALGFFGNQEFKPEPPYAKNANGHDVVSVGMIGKEPEPERSDADKFVRANTWLANLLTEFEDHNFATVEPDEMRLNEVQLGILASCADWMQRIVSESEE